MRIVSLSMFLALVVGCGSARELETEQVDVADEAVRGDAWELTPLLAVVNGPLCSVSDHTCVADLSGTNPKAVRPETPPREQEDLGLCSGTPTSLSGCKPLPPLPSATCQHGNCLCTGSIDCAGMLSGGHCVGGTENCIGTGGTPGENDVSCSCVKN